jgi:hypothetical protein
MQPTPGIYKHYKGKLYQVIGTALHSETLEPMVVYKTLYATDTRPIGQLWVRPAAMFMEQVLIDGKSMPRFELLEPEQPTT